MSLLINESDIIKITKESVMEKILAILNNDVVTWVLISDKKIKANLSDGTDKALYVCQSDYGFEIIITSSRDSNVKGDFYNSIRKIDSPEIYDRCRMLFEKTLIEKENKKYEAVNKWLDNVTINVGINSIKLQDRNVN